MVALESVRAPKETNDMKCPEIEFEVDYEPVDEEDDGWDELDESNEPIDEDEALYPPMIE